jgi:hypothetical protein
MFFLFSVFPFLVQPTNYKGSGVTICYLVLFYKDQELVGTGLCCSIYKGPGVTMTRGDKVTIRDSSKMEFLEARATQRNGISQRDRPLGPQLILSETAIPRRRQLRRNCSSKGRRQLGEMEFLQATAAP